MKRNTEVKNTPVRTSRITFRDILIKYNAPLILLFLIIVSSIVSSKFLSWRNITTVLLQQVPYLIISMGVMLTIMTAGIDLSVAAVAGCANVFIAMLITQWGFSSVGMLFAAIALTLVMGCVFGALNGLFIGKMRMAPFIISLAMMSVAQGVTYIISGGAQFRMKDEFPAAAALNWFAAYRDPVLGIPIGIYLVIIIILVFWFVMRFTPFGRLVLAVGSNEAAVRLAGINVTKYKFIVYVISGGLAAAAGVFNTGRTALGTPLNAIQRAGGRQGHRRVHGRRRPDPGLNPEHHEPGGPRVLPAVCGERRRHHPRHIPLQTRPEEQLNIKRIKSPSVIFRHGRAFL
jgi:ribose transport system permease protein